MIEIDNDDKLLCFNLFMPELCYPKSGFFSQMFIFFHYRHVNLKNTNFQAVFRLFTYCMLACVYILAEEIKCDADKALHNRCPHSLTTDLQSAFGKKTNFGKNCQVKMCHLDRLQPKKTVIIKLKVLV